MAYQRGSGFIGLQQYLGANQEAAQRMGQQLTEQVNREGLSTQQAIDAARWETERQIAMSTPQFNPWETAAPPGQEVSYQGPTALKGADALATRALTSERRAQMAGTEEGRSVLMAQGRRGPVSQGGSMLDSFLAGRGGGADLQRSVGAYSRLRDYLGGAEQAVAGKVAAAQGATEQVRQRYRDLEANRPKDTSAQEEVPYYLQAPGPPEHPLVRHARQGQEEAEEINRMRRNVNRRGP